MYGLTDDRVSVYTYKWTRMLIISELCKLQWVIEQTICMIYIMLHGVEYILNLLYAVKEVITYDKEFIVSECAILYTNNWW